MQPVELRNQESASHTRIASGATYRPDYVQESRNLVYGQMIDGASSMAGLPATDSQQRIEDKTSCNQQADPYTIQLKGMNPFDLKAAEQANTVAQRSPTYPDGSSTTLQGNYMVPSQKHLARFLSPADSIGLTEGVSGTASGKLSLPKIKRVFVSPKRSHALMQKYSALNNSSKQSQLKSPAAMYSHSPRGLANASPFLQESGSLNLHETSI